MTRIKQRIKAVKEFAHDTATKITDFGKWKGRKKIAQRRLRTSPGGIDTYPNKDPSDPKGRLVRVSHWKNGRSGCRHEDQII